MLTRNELETAAFWDEDVCLECGARQARGGEDCLTCASERVAPATSLLEIHAWVEGLAEGESDD
jgi:ribosomal protein L40E